MGYNEFTALWITSTPLVQIQILQLRVTSFSFFHREALQLNIGRFTTRYKLKIRWKDAQTMAFSINFSIANSYKNNKGNGKTTMKLNKKMNDNM